jgi:competence protein ComEC
MRVLAVLGIVAVAPALPAWAQEPGAYVVRASAAPCLRIRSSPDASASHFACIEPGAIVTAVGVAPFWRQVRLADGLTGWAAKKYLEPVGALVRADTAARDDAWLVVHVVDVGQGDGIWIQTFDDNLAGNGRYEGKNIVIDGGPAGATFADYVLERAHPGAVIDALVITHPHVDHYRGAAAVVQQFEVREFYDPGYPSDRPTWTSFLAQVAAETANGTPITRRIGRDEFGTPDWGSELDVRFVYSWPGDPAGLGSGSTRENNASIVLRIQYGTQSILFMGDAEGKDRTDDPGAARYVERWLLDSLGAEGLRSTVLKIAHHGSETSSTTPFIAAVDPEFVVVSSGRQSFSGTFIPDATTLARYCAHDPATRIYRTDQDDATERRTASNDQDEDHVIIRTNGSVTLVQGLSGGQPITHTSC